MFFTLLYFSSLTAVNAFDPIEQSSWLKKCEYKITKYSTSGTFSTYSDWTEKECNSSIDMSSYTDGIYKLYFKAEDNTQDPSSNKMTSVLKWTYRIDKTAPKCILNDIEFHWIDNQYYSDGNLYYKQSSDASWILLLDITCTDTDFVWTKCNWESCVSWIKSYYYPTILWATANIVKNTWDKEKSDLVLKYSWSWNQADSFNILDHTDFVEDNAWNKSKLVNNNTKVKFCNSDWSNCNYEVDNVSRLNLIWDSTPPVASSNFIYKSWNNWTWSDKDIVDWDNMYFAALDNRVIKVPEITDNWAGVRSFDIKIEKNDNKDSKKTYSYTWSTFSDNRITSLWNNNITHNFQSVTTKDSFWQYKDYESEWFRKYSWQVVTKKIIGTDINGQICDMVGNCFAVSTPDFKVVANMPDSWKTTINPSSDSEIKSNYSDDHYTYIKLRDKYDNEVVAVSGVKTIDLDIKFDNTLWKDQLTDPWSWNWVGFSFKDHNENTVSEIDTTNKYHDFEGTFYNRSELDKWELNIYMVSAVPTKNEYKTKSGEFLYWSLTAKLKLTDFDITVNSLISDNWVWEYDVTWSFKNNVADFIYNPVISFDYIDTIYPILEWQERTLKLESIYDLTNNNFNLDIKLWTNNDFLEFDPETFNIDTYNQNGYSISFFPKTTWGINNDYTNVALYSNLTYTINGQEVKLPGIQTGFKNYWVHTDDHFTWTDPSSDPDSLNNTYYDSDSSIVFSEINISWLTQTDNKTWNESWTWAVTTDDSTYNDFSKITLFDLKTDIHKNVESLLRWVNVDNYIPENNIIINDINSFDSNYTLPWSNDILYIKDKNVTISCTGDCQISGKKTIIIENWNLKINSNMYYSKEDSSSILWIILIWNSSSWSKSQLQINENITNGVWVVYAEWPVVSINNIWTMYDWSNVWNNLVHQLHWKGSFITRNTVWWSIKDLDIRNSCPYWTPDYEKSSCTQEKAQAYDLIYLRRYARVKDTYYWVVSDKDGKVPLHCDIKDIKVAWWDEFKSWSCDFYDDTTSNLIPSSNYDAPFILDYDPNLQVNPPYGFE